MTTFRASRQSVVDEFKEYVKKSPLCHGLLDKLQIEELGATKDDFASFSSDPMRVFVVEHSDFLSWCNTHKTTAKLYLEGCHIIIDEIHEYMALLEQALIKDVSTMYKLVAEENGMLSKRIKDMDQAHPLKFFLTLQLNTSFSSTGDIQTKNIYNSELMNEYILNGIDSAASAKADLFRLARFYLWKCGLVTTATKDNTNETVTLTDIQVNEMTPNGRAFRYKMKNATKVNVLIEKFIAMQTDTEEDALKKALAYSFALSVSHPRRAPL